MLQKDTLEFFDELRLNNHKDWFDQNRWRYEKVKKDYHRLVEDVLTQLQKLVPGIAHLKVKDCTFRINRDIRFSNDKTPYKTHLGIIISPMGKRMQNAGYYVHIDSDQGSFAGGGIYMPQGDALKKIRKEVDVFYDDLLEIIHHENFEKTYGDLDRSDDITLVRPPKGYEQSNPAIHYLKLKSFTATLPLHKSWLTDKKGTRRVVENLVILKPFIDFLNRGVLSEDTSLH